MSKKTTSRYIFAKIGLTICEPYFKWNKFLKSYSSNIFLANRSEYTQDVWLTCVLSRALVATLQLWWQRSSTLLRRDLEQLQTRNDKAHVNQSKLQLRSICLATSRYFNLTFRDSNAQNPLGKFFLKKINYFVRKKVTKKSRKNTTYMSDLESVMSIQYVMTLSNI